VSLDATALAARVAAVREAVGAAARRSGRAEGSVELLAAVKYLDAADVPVLHGAGLHVLGENRSDALAAKQASSEGMGITWDFIGHLQSRKVRDVVGRVRLIHALESESAAAAVDRRAQTPQDVLVEVNVACDPHKYGVSPERLDPFLELLATLDRVRVRGLMTMPPAVPEPEGSRGAFAALRELATRSAERWEGRHRFDVLSMGTSQDYLVAVEEGATVIRLGGALYDRSSG